MQKTAQDTQPQIGNPDTARRIYAFATARINPDWISLKVWLLGGVIRARNIAVAALPDLIAQIDAALTDGCEVITLDGAEFSAPEKVLSGIKKEFSYCCLGASDANHVPVKPSFDTAESVKKCGAKQKASAPATEQARYLSTPLCAMGGSDCTAPSASQARPSCGAGVAADLSAIRADLAEMRESQAEFFENLAALLLRVAEVLNDGENAKPKQPRGLQKSTVEAPSGAAIRTKRGRTSVVVGVRKVAKFQPKTKGKSK